MADVFSAAAEFEARGRFGSAIAEYDRLMASPATTFEAVMRRAALFRERGELPRAIADLERAEAIAPQDPWPKFRLGQLANGAGRNVVAARYMQAALDAAPHHDELRVNAANMYSTLGWLDLAFNVARQLPSQLSDWWARARKTALTDYQAKRQAVRAMLSSLGRRRLLDREERWRLTQDLFALGRLRLSRRLCEDLVREGPHSPPAFYHLAQIIIRQEGVETAIRFLLSSESIRDDLPDYPIRLARLLMEAGRYDEALEHLAHPAVRGLDSEEVRWIRFNALLTLGQRDRLAHYCRRWLEQAPDSLAPAGYLAAMFARDGDKLGMSVNASPLKPHIMQFWDSVTVPDDVAAIMESWRKAHPSCRHVVFDEDDASRFLEDHYGSDFVDIFRTCYHPAMKADFFRIAFLYKAGGSYADADERCLQPMEDILLAGEEAEIVATLSGDVPGYLHNWFLGARPRSRIMRIALDDAAVGLKKDFQAGRRPDIWLTTGPGLITRAVGRYLMQVDEPQEGALLLLPLQQYRILARTESSLAYKTVPKANWQLA